MTGHWSRVCRTAPHLVKLYQAEKGKEKATETNYIKNEGVGNCNMPSMDSPSFLNQDGDTTPFLNFENDLTFEGLN